MQPYFVPYAGYFRLFAAADVVVMYDCVQFSSDGWVHRNRLPLASGELGWLTLPLAKSPINTLIRDLAFAADAPSRFDVAIRRFPLLVRAVKEHSQLVEMTKDFASGTVADYLCSLIATINADLGFSTPAIRSSSLQIPLDLRGQERVIAIAERLGAARYLNPPGGRALLDADTFRRHGIDLRFLPWYEASNASILARLLSEPADAVAGEIRRQTALLP
jgi:hypothetical protein